MTLVKGDADAVTSTSIGGPGDRGFRFDGGFGCVSLGYKQGHHDSTRKQYGDIKSNILYVPRSNQIVRTQTMKMATSIEKLYGGIGILLSRAMR